MSETKRTRKEDRFLNYTSLQYENKALKREVEEFRNGTRYTKLRSEYGRVIDGYVREIKKLRKELADAHAETVSVRDIWFDECEGAWDDYRRGIEKLEAEINRLTDKYWEEVKKSDERIAAITREYEEVVAEKDAEIEALKAELAHATALLGRDSTNTSLPTGQTPPNKDRHIPNSRRNTGKRKGGQPGHKKHTLEKPAEEDVNEIVEHPAEEGEACPTCGSGDFTYTGKCDEKYEYDIMVKVIKRMHKYYIYRCNNCGELIQMELEPNLRSDCQYGANLQAFALSMMNTANAAINKVPMMINGLTNGELSPCEGYVAKLQKRAADGLATFVEDLFKVLITRTLIYWDDTVVMADKSRICLRFYGDEGIAYYVAHEKKDMKGILEDGVLDALTEMSCVMHDHNSINYNPRFIFMNIECNAHIQRDLQKSADDTGHAVLIKIKDLISRTIKDRNDVIASGGNAFEKQYVEGFNNQMTLLLEEAAETAKSNKSSYSGPTERALIRRISEYRDNFFAWVGNFTIPTTNNLSERALRGVKTKMKVSGQFASVKTAGYYATIKTYIETCRRNGINEAAALTRLCRGNPYTVKEIFG